DPPAVAIQHASRDEFAQLVGGGAVAEHAVLEAPAHRVEHGLQHAKIPVRTCSTRKAPSAPHRGITSRPAYFSQREPQVPVRSTAASKSNCMAPCSTNKNAGLVPGA